MKIVHLDHIPDLTKTKRPAAHPQPVKVVYDFLDSPDPCWQPIPEEGEYKDLTSCGMSYYNTIKAQGLLDYIVCVMRGDRVYLIKGELYHG